MGAPVMVELEGETDPLEIARKELKYFGDFITFSLKAIPNPKMKWVSDERALAGVHFS